MAKSRTDWDEAMPRVRAYMKEHGVSAKKAVEDLGLSVSGYYSTRYAKKKSGKKRYRSAKDRLKKKGNATMIEVAAEPLKGQHPPLIALIGTPEDVIKSLSAIFN